MRKARVKVGEFEQASSDVWTCIALEPEQKRFFALMNPNLSTHYTLDAIINLTTDNAVMDAESHASKPQLLKPAFHFLEMEIEGTKLVELAFGELFGHGVLGFQ